MSALPGRDLERWMARAVEDSVALWGTTRPNPTVGAVVLDAGGAFVASGVTEPPGGRHAEVVALDAAGERARGGTIVVTLEPCNHTGRTGPCTERILAAGIATVVYAAADPNPLASGGAERLAAAGLEVTGGVGLTAGRTPSAARPPVTAGPLGPWLWRQRHGRPRITWKYAASLDGRSTAADGTSQWITGPEARAHTLARRARYDAIVVGSGTLAADDPSLTARGPDGEALPRQPLRCAMGETPIPAGARIRGDDGRVAHLATRDPLTAIRSLDGLLGRAAEAVLLEGGPHLAGAFLQAGLVDRIEAYLAPVLLGEGTAALAGAGVGTIAEARRFTIDTTTMVGSDLFAELSPAGTNPGTNPGTPDPAHRTDG